MMVAEKGISVVSAGDLCILDEDSSCVQSSKKLNDGTNQGHENGDQVQIDSNIHADLAIDNFCEVVVTFRCKFCHCVCADKVSMKLHIIKAHADSSKFVLQEKEDKSIDDSVSSTNSQSENLNSGTDEMKQEVFFCSECSIIFSSAKLCCDHMTLVHNLSEFSTELIRENPLNSPPTVNKIRCSTQEKASKVNEKKSKLSSDNRHLCTLCKANFKSIIALQTHEKCHIFATDVSHTNNQTKKGKNDKNWVKGYACCYCEKTSDKFITWGQCALHLWKEHEVDCDLYMCSVCKFKTPTLAKLKDHERLHRSEANFKCNTCRKTFKQFKQLKTHEKYHKTNMTELPPPSDARWYTPKECPVCHRILSDSKCLKKHISAVHNKMKPYSCVICGHTSARKAELQLHVRQHTGEKPYKCQYPGCNFTTGDHNSLRKHKLRHGGVRPYKCPHCDYCVIQSHAYKKHVLATHPGKDVVFVCSSCPLVSVNEKAFEAHRKDHEEGRFQLSQDSSKVTNTKHNGLDETTASHESTESNDGKSSDKYWLRDEDSIEVVDTGGITIPATDSETGKGDGASHQQFDNNCPFNPVSSNSTIMSVQTCQTSSDTQNSTTFLSDNSTSFSITEKQQQEVAQECSTTAESQSMSIISNSKPSNSSKNKKKAVKGPSKAVQEKLKKAKTKKKAQNERPKKKKKKSIDQDLTPTEPNQSSIIRPTTMLSQHSTTSFGSNIDESRAISMVAELLADTDSNSLQFLDPILSMGINDPIDLADIICNDHSNDGTLDRLFNGFS